MAEAPAEEEVAPPPPRVAPTRSQPARMQFAPAASTAVPKAAPRNWFGFGKSAEPPKEPPPTGVQQFSTRGLDGGAEGDVRNTRIDRVVWRRAYARRRPGRRPLARRRRAVLLAPAADGGEGVGGAPPPTHLAGFDVSQQQANASSDRQARMLAAAGMSATPTRAPPGARPGGRRQDQGRRRRLGRRRGRGPRSPRLRRRSRRRRAGWRSRRRRLPSGSRIDAQQRQARMAAAAGGAGRGRGTPAKLDPAQAARIGRRRRRRRGRWAPAGG